MHLYLLLTLTINILKKKMFFDYFSILFLQDKIYPINMIYDFTIKNVYVDAYSEKYVIALLQS
jgi:hypothetical protein